MLLKQNINNILYVITNERANISRNLARDEMIISFINSFIFLKTFNSESKHVEVSFTDQNPKPLETEGKIKVTLVIN